MRHFTVLIAALVLLGAGCTQTESQTTFPETQDYYFQDEVGDHDYGYNWAEDYDIRDFEDCQYEFGTGDAEDGCNDYIRDNYSGYRSFGNYDCTEDCSGHQAGYDWAEENDIYDHDDCGGYSDSFIEGCWQYVDDYY